MNLRLSVVGGLALVIATIQGASARDFEMGGDNQYSNSIMAPEPGTAVHHRAAASRRARHISNSLAPKSVAIQSPHRNFYAVRGSSGSVLPTPLPRTQLIPPEGGGIPATSALPQQQGATVLPGMNPVPNLPHGPETFQDRASRCAHQQGLYGVPATASNQYMSACAM
jgi:hypothetical protein